MNTTREHCEILLGSSEYDCYVVSYHYDDEKKSWFILEFVPKHQITMPKYVLTIRDHEAASLRAPSAVYLYRVIKKVFFQKNVQDTNYQFYFVKSQVSLVDDIESKVSVRALQDPSGTSDMLIIKMTNKDVELGNSTYWLPLKPILRPLENLLPKMKQEKGTLQLSEQQYETRLVQLETEVLGLKSYLSSLRRADQEQKNLIETQSQIIEDLSAKFEIVLPIIEEYREMKQRRAEKRMITQRVLEEAEKQNIGLKLRRSPSRSQLYNQMSTSQSPRSRSPRLGSPRLGSPRTNSPGLSSPRTNSPRSHSPRFQSGTISHSASKSNRKQMKSPRILKNQDLELEENEDTNSDTKSLIFPQSTLITNPVYQSQLGSWYGNPKQKWKLIYRGTRDGFGAQDFHSRCDKAGPTITVIQTPNNCLFGGYLSKNWESKGKYIVANRCWLYSIRRPNEEFPIQIPCTDTKVAALGTKDCLCAFGQGYDLYICSHSNLSSESYSMLGKSYKTSMINMDSEHLKSSLRGFFCGSFHFKTKEIEVFGLDLD